VSGRDPATAQMQESVRLKVVVERLQWCKTDFLHVSRTSTRQRRCIVLFDGPRVIERAKTTVCGKK
ncbi:hypothetical protein, partial [Rubrimonas sp.]|uniref:hypothetical protein n=1 Tax=Rubrimonas sp. TaxID=2036015 RepID=UPI002FDDCA48